MRVTDRMMFNQTTANLDGARSREEVASQESETGLRVSHPWDDPGSAGLIASGSVNQKRFSAIASSVGAAGDELQSADSALNTVTNALSQAQSLAVQMSNATYSATQRAGAASEVQGILASILGALNTQVGNRYIFGGDKDSAPPFDSSGNYQGDANVRQVEIAPGVYQASSVRADVGIKGTGGGVDVVATLQALETALQNNDQAGVQGTLDGLASSTQQVSLMRSQVGSAMNVMTAAESANKTNLANATTSLSHMTDADEIDSASNLTLAEQALDAAMTAATKTFQLSIVDKMQ